MSTQTQSKVVSNEFDLQIEQLKQDNEKVKIMYDKEIEMQKIEANKRNTLVKTVGTFLNVLTIVGGVVLINVLGSDAKQED